MVIDKINKCRMNNTGYQVLDLKVIAWFLRHLFWTQTSSCWQVDPEMSEFFKEQVQNIIKIWRQKITVRTAKNFHSCKKLFSRTSTQMTDLSCKKNSLFRWFSNLQVKYMEDYKKHNKNYKIHYKKVRMSLTWFCLWMGVLAWSFCCMKNLVGLSFRLGDEQGIPARRQERINVSFPIQVRERDRSGLIVIITDRKEENNYHRIKCGNSDIFIGWGGGKEKPRSHKEWWV